MFLLAAFNLVAFFFLLFSAAAAAKSNKLYCKGCIPKSFSDTPLNRHQFYDVSFESTKGLFI